MPKAASKKKRVIIVCVNCDNEVTCSPGMARSALEGKFVCVKCEGSFKAKEEQS